MLYCHTLGGGQLADDVEPMREFGLPMTQSLVETAPRGN
jgi:hypothetical protein